MLAEATRPSWRRTVSVRPPSGPEKRVCRMLLPEAFQQGGSAEFLLALAEPPLQFLGAGAYVPIRSSDGQPAWQVMLRVADPCRRQGVGTQLLQALRAQAQLRGIATLLTWHQPEQQPEADPFLRHQGFTREDRFTLFEADIERLAGSLGGLRDWLMARDRVPPGARVVPLREAPLDQVARLNAQSFGGTSEEIARRMRQALMRQSTSDGQVVMLGDEVAGALLMGIDGTTCWVDTRVVAAPYRGRWANIGWANLLLLSAGLEWGLARGVQCVRFVSSAKNRNTMKLAARCAAEVVQVADLYALKVPAFADRSGVVGSANASAADTT